MTEPGSYYSARSGMDDPETRQRWEMLRLEQLPAATAAEKLSMRAERDGTSPAELADRRARRIAELDAELRQGGLIPASGGTGEPAVTDTRIRVSLPDDDRPDTEVCVMCVRTLPEAEELRVEVRPGVFACDCCAGLEQDVPVVTLEQWMLSDREYKRAAIAATYRTDPATMAAAEPRTEVARVYTDADGVPLGVTQATAMTAASLVPLNICFSQERHDPE